MRNQVEPDEASIRREIECEFNAYVHAITVLGSLRDHFQKNGLNCYIEKKIDKKEGNFKTPDLLVCSSSYVIIDHKYTESKDGKNLQEKIDAMSTYNETFLWNDRTKGVIEFSPEVVMLTPKKAVQCFSKYNCPITWGYDLNGLVTVEQSIGKVSDHGLASMFNPFLLAQNSEEAAKYKFILSHAPLAYTTFQVYAILWTLYSTKDYFNSTFEVKYGDILRHFNSSFSPWISPEARQLYPTRLKEALEFLKQLNWIEYDGPGKKIKVFTGKGRRLGDTMSYLITEHTKREYAKRLKEFKQKGKGSNVKIGRKESKQVDLGLFLGK